MKRKRPSPEPAPVAEETLDSSVSFTSLGLDPRLLQGISKLGFATPTLVQAKAIPLALEGKDILARAKTGSGKTAAYLIPVLHGILKAKETAPTAPKCTRALMLVPTKELAEQVLKMTERLAAHCGKAIRTINLAQNVSEPVQRALLSEHPDIIIATPSRAMLYMNSGEGLFEHVKYFVIDEADLVLSYGYEDDLQGVSKALPKGLQTWLMSATLTKEVETLKALFCRKPAILRLEEAEEAEVESVQQFMVKCGESEKFLLAYVIFKLQLIKGKCIIFVCDVDRCYRLKLFFEQFGIRACVLNSELPVNSRLHMVDEFNKNVYDIIIAADEAEALGGMDDEEEAKETPKETPAPAPESTSDTPMEATEAAEDTEAATADEPAPALPKKKKRKKPRLDKEFGVSRGIDFQNVACVLNFDLPTSSRSYTHRIGRTARAGRTGMALSFVIPTEQQGKHKPTSVRSTANDEKVLARITRHQAKCGATLQPYEFDMSMVDAFRYRMEDALRAVTTVAIREARTRELRNELLASDRLKRHFEENPEDLRHLRHDGQLRPARVQSHLRHVPEYLLPKGGRAAVSSPGHDVGFKKQGGNRIRKARERNKKVRRAAPGKGTNPLKRFRPGKK